LNLSFLPLVNFTNLLVKHAESKVKLTTLRIMWDRVLLTPFLKTMQEKTISCQLKKAGNEARARCLPAVRHDK
jgi:hypothetical protein